MNTLILDCSAGMSIYLLKDDEEFSLIDTNQKKHTDTLLLSVDKLLGDANLKVADIDNICVCVGPGSFTGIRVAVSIAKGLSIGTNAKIYVCSNFDNYSYGETEKSIYILDGFSDNVYARVFDGSKSLDSCENISKLVSDIKEKYSNFKVFCQSEKVKNILRDSGIESTYVKNNTVLCFKDKIKKGETTSINSISPIYLRASQAEVERERKLNAQK